MRLNDSTQIAYVSDSKRIRMHVYIIEIDHRQNSTDVHNHTINSTVKKRNMNNVQTAIRYTNGNTVSRFDDTNEK